MDADKHSRIIDAAIHYAERGWHVFPVVPGDKQPITAHGYKDATCNIEVIKGWWLQNPSANVAIATGKTSGIIALDFDVKKGQQGRETFELLQKDIGSLDTLASMTPSGGWHLIFECPDEKICNRTGILPGLDIRGDGGYIVAPGSVTPEGEYRWHNDNPIKALPTGLRKLLVNGKSKGSNKASTFDRASVLDGVPEGQRDDKLHSYACSLQARGVDKAEAIELARVAATRCKPPFDIQTALEKIERVYSTYAAVEITESPFTLACDLGKIPETVWRIERFFEANAVVLLYAPKDHYKSFLGVDWFLSIAAGAQWNNKPVMQGTGAYILGEGASGISKRILAWGIHHNVDIKTLPMAVSKFPMQVLDVDAVTKWADHIQGIVDHYCEPMGIIVIDTLATNFGPGNQNDPSDMSRFIAHIRIYLASRFNCTVLIVHHTGKDADRGARGGSSIEMDSDTVFYLKRIVDTDGDVELHCKHTKDSERAPTLALRRRIVDLGITDAYGEPITSCVLDPFLTQQQDRVLEFTRLGHSQRRIADILGKGKTLVVREQKTLRDLGMLNDD